MKGKSKEKINVIRLQMFFLYFKRRIICLDSNSTKVMFWWCSIINKENSLSILLMSETENIFFLVNQQDI